MAQAPTTGRGAVPDAPVTVPLPEGAAPHSPPVGRAGSLQALDLRLGPIPKEVAVGEGVGLDPLRRIAAVPNTTVGFVLRGGNTLRPEDVARLSRLPRVHLYLTAPVLPVHLEVLRKVRGRRALTVSVPEGTTPDPELPRRLALAGPTFVTVRLEGAFEPAWAGVLAGLAHGELAVQLPEGGFTGAQLGALQDLEGPRLAVIVPARARPEAVRALAPLRPARLVLETAADRLDPAVARAAAALGVPTQVRFDDRLTAADLEALPDLPHLEIRVWLGDRQAVPRRVTDLLARSEGPDR